MEASGSKGSSKRKPAFTMKVKMTKKRVQSDSDEDDFSDAFQTMKKNRSKGNNSSNSDVDSIPDLPEGTVVVKPEAVKEKKPRFSGPEFSKAPENLDIVNCTACGRQINPNVSGAAKRHPDLKVLVCRKCYVYYRSGKIEQDEDGLDEQCRWCGEGGRLSGCDYCHNAFCKSCIIRNFSRAELTKIMADDDSKWKCYVCEPDSLKKLLKECDELFKKIEKEKIKAKLASSRSSESSRPSRETSRKGGPVKGQKSDGKSASGHNKDLISLSSITVSSTNFMDTVSQVLGLTTGFQTMLEVLKSGLACGDVENSSRDISRSAKTFETGLQQFLRQVIDIVNEAGGKSKVENGDTEDDSIISNGVIGVSDSDDTGKPKPGRKSHDRKSYTPVRVKDDSYYGRTGYKSSKREDVVEIKDSNSEDEDDNLPVSFGPVGDAPVKAQEEEEKMDTSVDEPKIVETPSKASLGEAENEAAQLELLKELAEEMCKEQRGRKEKEMKEEEEKMEVETIEETPKKKKNEKTAEDDKSKKADSPTKEAISSGESDTDDVSDDYVSSSDLLMSSDGETRSSRKTRKKKDTHKSGQGKESKKERKERKKREKKERRKAEKAEKKEKKEKQKREKKEKKKSKKNSDSDSEEDLDKLIDKLEEDPVIRKKKKKEEVDSSVEEEPDAEKSEKKSEKSTGETKGRRKKKKTASSSSDDNDDDDNVQDDVDEEEEEEEENATKLRNGKDTSLENVENGKDIDNERAKAELMAEMEDDDDDAANNEDDDDTDIEDSPATKKGKGKKGEKSDSKPKKDGNEEDDEDEKTEEEGSGPSKRKRIRSKLLDAKLSDSGSDAKKSKSKKKKVDSDESDSEDFVIRKRSRKKKKDSSDEEEDSDDSDGKKKKKRGRKKKKDSSDEEDESDSDGKKKKKKKGKGKKKKQKKGKKRKLGSDSDISDLSSSSSSEDSDSEVSLDTSEEERREKLKAERKAKRKAKGAKRRRIKQQDDSSDEDKLKSDISDDDDHDDEDMDDDENKSPDKSGRKNIRKIKSDKKLTDATRKARKVEEARRKRVAEMQKEFNHVVQIEGDVKECPITTQLVLEFDKETKKPLLQVNKKLVRKLKPHQVEACKFMWDCLCESTDRMKKKEGSGCILAHCMGLGKTLSVISFVHTMLKNEKLTKVRTGLIVCPLNTVINWRNEWDMWFDEDDKVDIYEMSGVKNNWSRADYLKDWQEGGGIMIIGYEMYRNLTMGARIKNKKQKAIFQSTLVDPGPDLVVCDEGHILKNDSSAISQALNKVRTRRRIVLTGTPLQNNLIEYHCMTSFVKPNLMGTRKEFLNRFVNPITNGQHSDSTSYDVKVMGRRAHVLHEMLAGCVQRRDYSALTKFLPPKFEYVISVRLTEKQINLYQKYLDNGGITFENAQGATKGARLFSDYQNLMKIWTHPWVLKLSEIRAEQRMKYDDSEDSFIDNSSSEGEGSMSEGNSDESVKSHSESEESVEAGPSSGQRRSRRGKPPPEDSDKDEVVKDWKTRSRGGEGEDDDDIIELDEGPKRVSKEWWADYVQEEDENKLDLSGKLILLFEILRMCEEIGDKVLIFSQSLLSLDIIEYFLDYIDKQAQEEAHQKAMEEKEKEKEKKEKEKEKKENEKKENDEKDGKKEGEKDGEKKDGEEKEEEEVQEEFGKSWTKGADYFRMDGSTSPQLRSQWADYFNDPENFRARLFLISTRAGSLGINLVAANRVIIFDASWNPSHDVQSIFRVYRFGQTKPCYIYRFLAQGTMEEKIYERQVTKQSLSQRVVDEHQIDRHFTANDLNELYNFKPDRLDDPNRQKVVHSLPKDVLLAELLKSKDTYISKFHEHDSLLENRTDQVLSEEDKKAAWEDYENERKGISNRVAQASTASGMGMFSPDNVMQIVQMVKMRFPNLPPDMFQAQVQAILQQQILYQQSLQKQQIEQQRMMEMQRLHRIQQDIRSQQRQINSMTRQRPMMASMMGNPRAPMGPGGQGRNPVMSGSLRNMLTNKPEESNSRSSTPNQPPRVIDLSNS